VPIDKAGGSSSDPVVPLIGSGFSSLVAGAPDNASLAFQIFTKVGGGGSVNLSFQLAPSIRILTNNFYSNGGGRYIFGRRRT
jgi:hypothetical protein